MTPFSIKHICLKRVKNTVPEVFDVFAPNGKEDDTPPEAEEGEATGSYVNQG